MQKNQFPFIPPVNFTELTPQICIGIELSDTLYEKAFLSRTEDPSKTEYALNTTTWD